MQKERYIKVYRRDLLSQLDQLNHSNEGLSITERTYKPSIIAAIQAKIDVLNYVLEIKGDENITTEGSDAKCYGTPENPMTEAEWNTDRKNHKGCLNPY